MTRCESGSRERSQDRAGRSACVSETACRMLKGHVGGEQIVVPKSRDSPELGVEIFPVETGKGGGNWSRGCETAMQQLESLRQPLTPRGFRAVAVAGIRGRRGTVDHGSPGCRLSATFQQQECRTFAGNKPVHHAWPVHPALRPERCKQPQVQEGVYAANKDRARWIGTHGLQRTLERDQRRRAPERKD